MDKAFKVKQKNKYIGVAKANTNVIKELLFVGVLGIGINSTSIGISNFISDPTPIAYEQNYDETEEIEARYEFVSKYKDEIKNSSANESQMIAFDLVYDFVSGYMESGAYKEQSYRSRILDKLILLSETLEKYNNITYDNEVMKVK